MKWTWEALGRVGVGLALLGIALFGACPAPVAAEETFDLSAYVPMDPAVTIRNTLPNGMRYWIRPNKKPRGSVSLVLHVASGSVHEAKNQQGLAHFVEHMAFEGSKNFPPGSVVPYFSSQGITFGLHQNASTSFACTEYSIHMPSFTEESFGRSLLFLSDAARHISFEPEEVKKEIPVILEEFRVRGGMEGRLWARRAPLLLKGSRYALRLPIGKKTVVRATTAETLRAYHRTWYRPGRTTLVVAGDIDPAVAEAAIQKTFGDWKRPNESAPKLRMGRLVARGLRVGVFDDPDQHYTRVTVTHTRAAREWKTYEDLRRRLVEDLAVRMMNARFEYLRRTKGALFAYAWMRQRSLVPGVEMVECGASGMDGRWIGCLREIVHEVERVHRHGFTPAELGLVRANVLAKYDGMSEQTSSAIAKGLQWDLARERKPVSRDAWERVARACLPKVTAQDVSHAFRALFDFDNAAIVLSVSEKKDAQALPNEPEVLDYYEEAREDKLGTWSERNEALFVDAVLKTDPEPGDVASQSTDEELGVTSLVMKNGVRVHLRKLKTPGRVYVRVSFLGGKMQETDENLGITDLAFGSLGSDGVGTKRIHPDTVTRYLMTRQMDFACRFDQAVIRYDIWATQEDLADAMRLLWLLLTQPHVDYNAMKEMRQSAYSWGWSARRDVSDMADHLVEWHLSGQDPRRRMPDWEAYEKITEEAAKAWLADIVRTAPMEVAIVGDIERKAAEELARLWFGSLPGRPDRLDAMNKLRKAGSWKGPVRHEEKVESSDPGAIVLLAWRGVDRLEDAERAALDHAASLIDARLFDVLREDHGLSYDVAARYAYDDVDGMSRLMVRLTTDPAKAKKAADVARKVVLKLAKEGPTKAELETVERQWRALLDQAKDSPSRWLSALSRLHIDGRELAGVKARLAGWRKADGVLMKKTLARVVKDERYCQVLSLPTPPEKKAGTGK